MPKVKLQLQRIVDWKGWRRGYRFEVIMIIAAMIYVFANTVFFSLCENCPHTGKASPKDNVAGGVVVLIAFSMSFLSVFFLKIKHFYKIFLIPFSMVVFLLLEIQLFIKIFLRH